MRACGGGCLLPQGARLNHRARLRRISSLCRHTHCFARVHPREEDRRRTQQHRAAVRAQRGTRELKEKLTGTRTRTRLHINTRACILLSKLGLWRDLRRQCSDAGWHGGVFAEGPAQTGGELRAFSDAMSRLRVFMNETMALCYRLRSCCVP